MRTGNDAGRPETREKGEEKKKVKARLENSMSGFSGALSKRAQVGHAARVLQKAAGNRVCHFFVWGTCGMPCAQPQIL